MSATKATIAAGFTALLLIATGGGISLVGATPSIAQQQEATTELSAARAARGGGARAGRHGAAAHRTTVTRGARGTAVRHTTAVRGPRGNVAVRSNVAHRGYYRGGRYYWRGWARPGRYYWPVGGAIAAGAAIGFVTAATAVGIATVPAPAPGMCWYYTNTSQTAGFWDVCPP